MASTKSLTSTALPHPPAVSPSESRAVNSAELPPILVNMQTGLQGLERGQALSPNGQVLLAEMGGDDFFLGRVLGALEAAAIAISHTVNGVNGALRALPNWASISLTITVRNLLRDPGFNRVEFISAVRKHANAEPTLRRLKAEGVSQNGTTHNQAIARWLDITPQAAGWISKIIRTVTKNTAF